MVGTGRGVRAFASEEASWGAYCTMFSINDGEKAMLFTLGGDSIRFGEIKWRA